MGSEYAPRLVVSHVQKNEKLGKIFRKRNFWGIVTVSSFILGSITIYGVYYFESQL